LTDNWSVSGPIENNFGGTISGAGDFNGDGYDDVIVGAFSEGNGVVYGYFGSSSGLITSSSWMTAGNSPGNFGYSSCSIGDINRDGFDDILIADPYWGGGEYLDFYGDGAVFVFLGNTVPSNVTEWEIDFDIFDSAFGYSVSGDNRGQYSSGFLVGAYEINQAFGYFGGIANHTSSTSQSTTSSTTSTSTSTTTTTTTTTTSTSTSSSSIRSTTGSATTGSNSGASTTGLVGSTSASATSSRSSSSSSSIHGTTSTSAQRSNAVMIHVPLLMILGTVLFILI